VLIDSGLSVSRALAAFDETAPPSWKRSTEAIRERVRQGEPLGSANPQRLACNSARRPDAPGGGVEPEDDQAYWDITLDLKGRDPSLRFLIDMKTGSARFSDSESIEYLRLRRPP
jgi:hypothetical protein